jgi:hypothetical protein
VPHPHSGYGFERIIGFTFARMPARRVAEFYVSNRVIATYHPYGPRRPRVYVADKLNSDYHGWRNTPQSNLLGTT